MTVHINTSAAQTGNIGGIVTDEESGKPLIAATIVIEGSGKMAVTDRFGRFNMPRVPAGRHYLKVELPGYNTAGDTVSVNAETTSIQHIEMVFDAEDGDRVFVKKQQKGIARANAGQFHSLKIGHIITADQMERTGDYSIASGVARIPGVQVGRLGELNIRGSGQNRFDVIVDGQRMASTKTGGRGVDLGGVSAEMARNVEVINVPTPDMGVEGASGVVQINTWHPIGKREISVRAGGLANQRYTRYTGIGNMASVHYSERFRDAFSLAVNLSYQKVNRGYESLGIDFDSETFGTDVMDVIEQLSPGLNSDVRDRFGGQLQLSYQPDAQSSYYFRGFMNTDIYKNERHINISSANGDWLDQTTTGNEGELGSLTYNPMLHRNNDYYLMTQAGGRHLLDVLNIEYNAGWAHSDISHNQFDFLFFKDELDYVVNMEDRTRPEMVISNFRLMEDGTMDPRAMKFDSIERIRDNHDEDRYSARLDFEIPLGPLSLKTGTSGLWTEKIRFYEEADLATLRSYNLMRFRKLPRSSFDVLDQYYFSELLHIEDAVSFVETSRPQMKIDEDDMFQRSHIWNYAVSEHIYSGYAMATLQFNRFTLLGGARLEQTDGTYEGHKVGFDKFNKFDSLVDTSRSVGYTNLLPNVQFIFSPTSHSNIKFAWSKVLKRADYQLLAPFEMTNAADTTSFKGNPDLKPMTSNNLDLIYRHLLSDVGAVTIGAFHKRLSNNRVLMQEQIVMQSDFPNLEVVDGESVEVRERTFTNSDEEASLYGFEVSWQQHLRFLPGFLGNLGVNANYTWSQSDIENRQNGRDIALRHQSPHVVNAALDYNQGRFSGLIAWHWTAAALYREASDVRWAPAVNRSEQIYLDLYEDGWMDLSATFGFRISESFRFWTNISNILPKERVRYGETRNLYPFDTVLQDGIRISAGLRFTL